MLNIFSLPNEIHYLLIYLYIVRGHMIEEVNLWRFVLYADEELDGSLLSSVSHSPITN